MMMIGDFNRIVMDIWAQYGNLPVNILINGKYYDIGDLFFDKEIYEYILELKGGIDYDTRANIVVPIQARGVEGDDKMIERFIVDDAGSLIDIDTGETYDYFEDAVELLNIINHEKIENKRELNTLKYKIGKLIEV